jgi:hypothetical protein
MFDLIRSVFRKDITESEIAKKYKEVFSGEAGKVVLEDLMKFGHINEISYRPGDPHQTSFNEGMRLVVTRILTYVEADLKSKPLNIEDLDA